jgi:hypothetical protein
VTELVLPPWIRPESPDVLTFLDDASESFEPAFARGFTQVQIWGDPRWRLQRTYRAMRGVELARLNHALLNLQGSAGTLRVSPVGAVRGGLSGVTELVVNGEFTSGTTGWSTSGSTHTVSDQISRVTNSGAATGYIINSSAITVANGATYVLRAAAYPGTTSSFRITAGSTSGATDYGSSTFTSSGLLTLVFTTSATNLFIRLYCNTSVSGDWVQYAWATVSRCGRINGGSQSGQTMITDAMPTSQTEFLKIGDWVEINNEVKQLTSVVNTDGSGNAHLQFRPSMVVVPADNDGVILLNPMGRFRLPNSYEVQRLFGLYGTAELDLVERYTS